MDIREAYYLGAAEKALVGDTKVWPIYDEFCYLAPTGGTYTYSYNEFPELTTSPNVIYRIMFRPLVADITTSMLFGGRHTDDNDDFRFLWSNGKARLDIGSSSISGGTIEVGKDYYFEFGNNYIKNLADNTIVASGATVNGAPALPLRVNPGYARIYQAEVWDEEDTCLHNFVPVRWFGGEWGMWDEVGNRFYPVSNQTRINGYQCSSVEPDWSGTTPTTLNWYLVPVTDSESDPPSGEDYVFYAPETNVFMAAVSGDVGVQLDVPVTPMPGGEYLIDDETYSSLTKWNFAGGLGGYLQLKGTQSYLNSERVSSPSTARLKDLTLASTGEPIYLNKKEGKVYGNLVSQDWCWAIAYRRYQGTGDWPDIYTTDIWKCNGAYASYDYTELFYVYRLVRKPSNVYTFYDYITPSLTTGNNFIRIPELCTTGFTVEAKFRLLGYVGGSVFGFEAQSDDNDWRLIYPSNRQLHFDFKDKRISKTYSVADDLLNKDLDFRLYNYGVYDNKDNVTVMQGLSLTTAPDLTMFRINAGSARIYYVQLKDGNTVLATLYPCRRNSDRICGLYDTTNNRFYTAENPADITASNV